MNQNFSYLARGTKKKQGGASLLEFAIAATLFFTLLLGAIVWALTMWRVNTIQYAVERGARCAILPVPPTGANNKQCKTPEWFAAQNVFGFQDVTADQFNTKMDEEYSQTLLGRRATKAACVKTTGDMNIFTVASELTKSSASAGGTRYCRALQD